jgi:hypothetical protein
MLRYAELWQEFPERFADAVEGAGAHSLPP